MHEKLTAMMGTSLHALYKRARAIRRLLSNTEETVPLVLIDIADG